MKQFTIIVESGHGKKFLLSDPGVVYKSLLGTMKERDYTVMIGKAVRDRLRDKGYRVVDVGIESEATLGKKLSYINSVIKTVPNPISVSIHVNGAASDQANGLEVWYSREDSSTFAQVVLSEMLEISKLRSRGTKKEKYGDRSYTRSINCPAILCECGFMSNKGDRKYLYENWHHYADAIVKGVERFILLS